MRLLATTCLLAGACALDPGQDEVEPNQPAPVDAIHAPIATEASLEPPAAFYGENAVAIATNQEGARSLSLSGHSLFWIAEVGGRPVLRRSGLAGSDYVALHMDLAAAPADLTALAAVPVFEYLGALWRFLPSGPEKLAGFAAPIVDLTISGRDLFLATSDGCVHALYDGADGFETLACGGGEPLEVVARPDGVWWGSTDGAIYAAIDGVAEPVAFASFAGELTVDHAHVYWAEGSRVYRTPRFGSGKIALVAETQGPILSLAGDRFFLYYSTKEDGAVWQMAKATLGAHRLTLGWSYPIDLVVAGPSRLYWTDPTEGLIVTQNL
jgi:hypothetical protein